MKKFTVLYLLLPAALLLAASCSEKKEAPAKSPIPVKVLTVGGGNSALTRDYVGTVEESTGSMLSFETGGNISRLLADEGDAVRKGQVLATIDGASLRDMHEAALAVLNQARDAHKRYGNLHKEGTVPDVKWAEIESKLKQAESAERIARTNLSHAVLRAPFSGTIASRQVDGGMNVAPGQPVFKLVQIDRVNIKVSVPEDEITQWSVGRQATLSVAALGGQTFTAKVSEKGVEADPAAHTYTVKLSLPNPSGKLMPGMVCRVLVSRPEVSGTAAEILPPRAVLLDDKGSRFVWLAVNGKATCRRVQTGQLCAEGVAITSGLNSGDRVIIDGNQKVSEGMKVKVL